MRHQKLPRLWSITKPKKMIALDLLHLLGLGGLCGIFGQLIRGVLGLKKAKHHAPKNTPFVFDFSRFALSCLLGFFIGAIVLVLMHQDADEPIPRSIIVTIMAIGYSGVDALEGLLGVFKDNRRD